MARKHKSEMLRALWHALFGVMAIIIGQVIPGEDDTKIRLVRWVGGVIVVLDVFIRLPLYHYFIKPLDKDVRHWGTIRMKIREVCILLEDVILIKTRILRPTEREFLATATPFVLGILIPLEFGAPLYAAMVGIIVLGFGDPAARETGVRIGINKVRENGKKSWEGFWGFVIVAGTAVIISMILDWPFPTYPCCQLGQLTLALVLGVFTGAFAELFDELVDAKTEKLGKWSRKMLRLFFDDNFAIPVTTASVIALVMAI